MDFSYQASDCKILVVDDLSENIQIIGNILVQCGYQVSYSLSGREALLLIKKNIYDLILLDVLMPGMDGYEVCNVIKKNKDTRDIPIVFLTAKTDPESILKGFKLGAADYVGKPCNPEELLARVSTQLQIKKQTEQLENWNLQLEEVVEARTNELKSAHENLALLDKAKSKFLMLISHELRSPIHVLNGFIGELHTSLKSSKHKDSIEYLKQSSDKIMDLAESALLITELQSGNQKLDFSKVNLLEVCESAIISFSDSIKDKSILVIHDFAEDALVINGDFNLVNRSIRNLIHNAIRYSPLKGSISFKSEKTEYYTVLSIEDTGRGFTREEMANLFQLFGKTKVDISNEGFGLDLASAKLVMDIHSGKIRAGNLSSGGAIITLSFPN